MAQTFDMVAIARGVLVANGFDPAMPPALERSIPPRDPLEGERDLRMLPWSSIDNEESRDLDQIEVAAELPDGSIRVAVGIADVDALVPKGSPIDVHALRNTTTLYTGVHVFPMLPEVLSVDRTSLLDGQERLAVITDFVVDREGIVDDAQTRIFIARVLNKAKLVYESVGAFLEGKGPGPKDPAIVDQLRVQDIAAQRLRRRRHENGALALESVEARTIAKDGQVIDVEVVQPNRARELIEDLMIAANGATARYLELHGWSSIRRVVRAPRRWDRLIELAKSYGFVLPEVPTPRPLAEFLESRKAADPARFADVSLAVVKLIGPGEYALQRATDPDTGHFGLAVDDYAHSTAPNRRYPDLVTQRLLKACARGDEPPYSDAELADIARQCTDRETSARKVERTMRKVAAAVLLSTRVGDTFDAIITGATDKGVFARLLHPAAEGRVVRGDRGLDVGDLVKVKLVDTNVAKGFVDFEALKKEVPKAEAPTPKIEAPAPPARKPAAPKKAAPPVKQRAARSK
jgi:exoribonuclease-2